MCGSDTTDPLVKKLFKEERLILLRTAFLADELSPGMIVVSYPSSDNRTPDVLPLERFIEQSPTIKIREAPYRFFSLSETSRAVEASAALQAAGILGEEVDFDGVEAALHASGGRKFEVSLEGAVRAELDLATAEDTIRAGRLTARGQEDCERGCRLHLVTRTVAANTVLLRGDADLEIGALAKVLPFASGKTKAKLKSARELTMQRTEQEMVIGFSALRILPTDEGLFLAGLERPLDMRGPGFREANAQFTTPDELGAKETVFVCLAKSP